MWGVDSVEDDEAEEREWHSIVNKLHVRAGVYELLVGKRAVNLRRDPLQRVRDKCVPMGGRGVVQ